MRVSKSDVICGLAAPAARQLMRDYRSARSAGLAAETLGLGPDDARGTLRALEAAGYLETVTRASGTGPFWVTTIKGNALAQASFGKPISRATAARHLGGVIDRTRAYNSDASYLLTVTQVVVFGSYLDPGAERLGDLDLAVTMVHRDGDGDRHVSLCLDYAARSGRAFGTIVDRLYWPQRELIMILKNRSPAISITTEDVTALTSRFEIIYRVSEDPGAMQPPPDPVIQR